MRATQFAPLLAFASATVCQSPETVAPFDAAVVVLDATSRMDTSCDFDADGHIDAIGVWRAVDKPNQPRIEGYRNDGHGNFTLVWRIEPKQSVHRYDDVVAARLDADARIDFYAAIDDELIAYRSTGITAPIELARYPIGTNVREIAAQDFDGDGVDEVVVLTNSDLRVVRLNGAQLAAASDVVATSSRNLAVGELTGDGTPDIVVDQHPNLTIYALDGGTLGAVASLSYDVPPFSGVPDISVADLDGDADIDIVGWMTPAKGDYMLWRRSGPASFTREQRAGGPATHLGDINGDGHLDGICCSGGGGTTVYNVRESTFHVALNDGTGQFAPAVTFAGVGSKHVAGAFDADGDGDTDLVAGRAVWFNRGSVDNLPMPLAPDTDVFDVDGDGDGDLSLSVNGVSLHDGDGTFTRRTLPVDYPPSGTRWVGPGWRGDFDGDGDVDLIVAHMKDGEPVFYSMRLLANVGSGQFVDAGPATPNLVWFNPALFFQFPYLPEDGVVRDIDNDGDLDVVARQPRTSQATTTWIFLNDGTGFFPGPKVVISGFHPLEVADLDGDGLGDLIGITVQDQLVAAMQTAPGAWSGATPLGVTMDHRFDRIAAADFDGDGDVDIGAIDRVTYSVAQPLWLANDGFGTFARRDLGPTVFRDRVGHFFDVGDLNADGVLDAIVFPVASTERACAVFMSANGQPFADRVVQSIRPGQITDVDGDGDLDVAELEFVRNARHQSGRRRQYGTSSTGMGGIVPVFGASGPFSAGESITYRATGLPGGALFSWQFGLGAGPQPDFPLPGMVGYAYPYLISFTFVASGTLGEAGTGTFESTLPTPASLAGYTLWQQLHVLDPTQRWSLGWTNGLEVEFGH